MNPYPPVVMATATPAVAPPARREIAFCFTGNASEYFRIWIVNTLLTIVTLGVYSAWAKVRNKQYFYRHTSLDGSTFEYHADPIAILKGRVIAAVALGLLFGSQHYSLTLYGILIVLFVIATPWVIVKALAFNARNSSFRNLRCAFAGRPGEAFGAYFGMVVLYMATCGLGYPYAEWRMTSFVVHRHLYGDLPFAWHSKPKDYYRAYLIALAMSLPIYILLVAIIAGSLPSTDAGTKEPVPPEVLLPLVVGAYSLLLIPGAFLRARIANLRRNSDRRPPPGIEPARSRALEALRAQLRRHRRQPRPAHPVGESEVGGLPRQHAEAGRCGGPLRPEAAR
jgi:uncharacterized membrane protein YjgN (DUF898 family)